MAYDLMALLTDEATLTLDQLGQLLRQAFSSDPNAEILPDQAGTGQSLVIRWKDWAFRITYEAGPQVLQESREIAEQHGGDRPDQSLIAACGRRISITGDEDPDMEHFNQHLLLMKVLARLPGVVVFDPLEKTFAEEAKG